MRTVVGGALGVTVAILFVLLIGEFAAARASHEFGESAKNQIANELAIPVG